MSKKKELKKDVSLDDQARLAEILNDSPRVVSLVGTKWEIRTLRMGVQWMIAEEVIKVNKAESKSFGDIVKQFSINIPSIIKIITLAILNDKNKIFKDGDERCGFSDTFKDTYDTLMWEGNVTEFGNLLLEILQMLSVDFFLESHRIMEIFRESTMTKKKTMEEQK